MENSKNNPCNPHQPHPQPTTLLCDLLGTITVLLCANLLQTPADPTLHWAWGSQ